MPPNGESIDDVVVSVARRICLDNFADFVEPRRVFRVFVFAFVRGNHMHSILADVAVFVWTGGREGILFTEATRGSEEDFVFILLISLSSQAIGFLSDQIIGSSSLKKHSVSSSDDEFQQCIKLGLSCEIAEASGSLDKVDCGVMLLP